jgi:hypothetical protein
VASVSGGSGFSLEVPDPYLFSLLASASEDSIEVPAFLQRFRTWAVYMQIKKEKGISREYSANQIFYPP